MRIEVIGDERPVAWSNGSRYVVDCGRIGTRNGLKHAAAIVLIRSRTVVDGLRVDAARYCLSATEVVDCGIWIVVDGA